MCAVLTAVAGGLGIVSLRAIQQRMHETSTGIGKLIDHQRSQNQQSAALRGLADLITNAQSEASLEQARQQLQGLRTAVSGKDNLDDRIVESVDALLVHKREQLRAVDELVVLRHAGDTLPDEITKAAVSIVDTAEFNASVGIESALTEVKTATSRNQDTLSRELDTLSENANKAISVIQAASKTRIYADEMKTTVTDALHAKAPAKIDAARNTIASLLENTRQQLAKLPSDEATAKLSPAFDRLSELMTQTLDTHERQLRADEQKKAATAETNLNASTDSMHDTLETIKEATLEIVDAVEFDAAITIDVALAEIKTRMTERQQAFLKKFESLSTSTDKGVATIKAALAVRAYSHELSATVKDAFLATDLAEVDYSKKVLSRLIDRAKNELAALPTDDDIQSIPAKIDQLPQLIDRMLNGKRQQVIKVENLHRTSREVADRMAALDRALQAEATATKTNAEQSLETTGLLVNRWQILLLVLAAGAFVLALIVGTVVFQSITRPLRSTVNLLKNISEGEGDLTKRLEVRSRDELGELANWFNTFVAKIEDMVRKISNAATTVRVSSKEQAAGAANQSQAIAEMSGTATELLTAARHVAESGTSVREQADRAAEECMDGTRNVQDAVQGITGIQERVQEIAQQMLDLGGKSQQISRVLDIINELTEQTNLLSLNASIEAAGAGNAGKRFAVVASEIRKLAERAGDSTTEIRGLINSIQDTVNTAIVATEEGTKSVEQGARLTASTKGSFERIAEQVASTARSANTIEMASRQQTTAIEQMNDAVRNVDTTAQQSETTARQTENEARVLAEAASAFRTADQQEQEV